MEIQIIQNKIYEIRGQRVMLDRDLAELYGVTTGNLNKAVKRNIERFPERFMFQLTKEEALRFQFGTLNEEKQGRGQHFKYLPYAFTELCQPLHNSVYVNKKIMQSLPLKKLIYNIKTCIFFT